MQCMKRFPRSAFTLVEMIVVIAVILVLVAITIPIAGYVNNRAGRTRAEGEISEMSAGLASYRTDFGGYPQDAAIGSLDPRVDFDPIGGATAARYRAANLSLYGALSGDILPAGMPDGKPEQKAYINFLPNRLKTTTLGGGALVVGYLKDPFGNPYGYSSVGAAEEGLYQLALKSDPAAPRPNPPHGYNPTFDLWSTAGQTMSAGANKWVKNWPDL
jgi:prepilin-type N-terminal cleavage/methylation domain-containing protein